MNRKIRYGIIGYGNFAERAIAPAIRASEHGEISAIQKRSLEIARLKAQQAGIPFAFDSVEALVQSPQVDAVFIVSANSAHCPETIAAARAGKHVLVEKPMSLTVAEGEQMIEACARYNVKFSVGHMVQLSPVVRRVHDLVASKKYGPVTFARADFSYDGRLTQRAWLLDTAVAGGGPLYDIGVHCLDTLRFVLQDEVTSVKAHLDPTPNPRTTESTAALTLRFARGTPASIYCSFASPVRRRLLEVVCRDAILSVPEFTANQEKLTLSIVEGRGDQPPRVLVEEFETPNLYTLETELFSLSLLQGNEVKLSGENGLRNMRVIEEALRQTREG
ncbi:MAG: Gfo/Idh/MocA family oxidoreductase [Bacteroidota bacterium]